MQKIIISSVSVILSEIHDICILMTGGDRDLFMDNSEGNIEEK